MFFLRRLAFFALGGRRTHRAEESIESKSQQAILLLRIVQTLRKV